MRRIDFLGVGDATDFPLGQTSVLYTGNCRLLVDCGPQIPLALTSRLESPDALDGIYVTHTHADHCFGLASLLLWMRQRGRRRPLSLLAETENLTVAGRILELGYPGAFAPSKCFGIVPVPLVPFRPHPFEGATLTIAQTAHKRPNFAVRIEDGARVVAVSGDGRPTKDTARVYAGLDLLIHECAWQDGESDQHSSVGDVVALARQLQPKHVAVIHCASEQRAHIEARLAVALGSAVTFPRPGDVIHLAAE